MNKFTDAFAKLLEDKTLTSSQVKAISEVKGLYDEEEKAKDDALTDMTKNYHEAQSTLTDFVRKTSFPENGNILDGNKKEEPAELEDMLTQALIDKENKKEAN